MLDLGNPEVTAIPIGHRIVAAVFQGVNTRTAGFSVVALGKLHPAVLVSYTVMMYISVYPVAISVRKTNVYEEQSLGIYADDEEMEGGQPSFVSTHILRQLGTDLWFIFLALFVICIIENKRMISDDDALNFSVFNILFEIVSGYGTVGLSIGYPTVAWSLVGEFKTLSKLVIILVMIRGRHRGLPMKLDRAILLPSEIHEE